MVRQRVRIRFSKQDSLRFIGHRDLVRSMERLFRRAGLPLAMSQGFHPKPRMSFPSALSVGIAGLDEVMELELSEALSVEEVLTRLTAHATAGLEFRSVERLPEGTKKAQLQRTTYSIPISADRERAAELGMSQLMARSSCMLERPKKGTTIDVRRQLENLCIQDGCLWMRLGHDDSVSASAREVLDVLGLADLQLDGIFPVRTVVELR